MPEQNSQSAKGSTNKQQTKYMIFIFGNPDIG